MSHTSLRPEFEELVELDAPAIQVATDCVFTEGPVWPRADANRFPGAGRTDGGDEPCQVLGRERTGLSQAGSDQRGL